MSHRFPLDLAAIFMFTGALFHIACLFGGADWLLFAGAPVEFSESYRRGDIMPIVWTLFIAFVLCVWGFYALAGARRIRKLPLMKTALLGIAALMLIRGAVGIVMLFAVNWPWHTSMGQFHAAASVMIFGVGLFYAYGFYANLKAR
ncbi:MAG: hypothetical protein ABJG88_03385 [Litorimonas sp.]